MASRRSSRTVPGVDRARLRLSVCLLAVCALTLGILAAAPAGAEIRSGEVDGYRYRLFVPEAEAPVPARPLLVVLHGYRQWGMAELAGSLASPAATLLGSTSGSK